MAVLRYSLAACISLSLRPLVSVGWYFVIEQITLQRTKESTVNDGSLATGNGTNEKISELLVGIEPTTSAKPAECSDH